MASWRSFSRLRRFKSKKPIDIQMVRREKFPEAVRFMRRNYLDDPFMRALGISARHKETHSYLSALWLTLLKSELSLAAVYRNKICGLCINYPHTHRTGSSPNDVLLQLAKLVKSKATRNLLHSWHKISRETPLPSVVDGQTKRIMELAGLAVGPHYRQLGIAQTLMQNSAHLAMLLGFDYVRADCTNMVTANICDRLGWQKIWQLPYDRFDGVLVNTLNEQENLTVKVYLQPVQSKARNV